MTVKVTTLKGSRKAAHPRKMVAKNESIKVQEAEKPIAEMKISPDNLETQIEAIDENVAPMDLKGIENNVMASLATASEANMSLAKVENELHMFTNLLEGVLGVSSIGILLVIWGILRLAIII
jgi:hypothetical protein